MPSPERRNNMQTDDRVVYLILALLVASTAMWIDVLRRRWQRREVIPLQPRRNVPWRPMEVVAVIMIVLFCVDGVLAQVFPRNPDAPPLLTLKDLQVLCLSQVLKLMLLPLILAIWFRCQWADFGLRRLGVLTDIQCGVWGLLLAQLPVHLVEYPLHSLRDEHPHSMITLLQGSGGNWQALMWIALEVMVLAPLVEELLFRVLLQGSLEREIPALWAIVLPAVAFVSIHQPTDSLPLLPLALILGYLYHRRHSYLAIVLLHGLFNGISLLSAVWSLKGM